MTTETVPSQAQFAVRKKARRPWGAIILFIGPAMVYFLIFVLYPLVQTFWNSVHTIAPIQGQLITTFVGLQNFRDLFDDDIFILSVKNTLIWGIVGPSIEFVTANVLAFLVYCKVPLHRFYRTAWFTPLLVSGVIVGLVFRWIFNFDWGLINVALRSAGLDELALNWLGRRDTPLAVVIFVHYWSTFGYNFILFLAGLSAISEELVEAAKIDGATTFQISVRILMPLLVPIYLTALILSFMGKMRAFNVVWVLTQGGPLHYSETVATYVQKRAFFWSSLDLGYPSAIAVAWFGVVLVGVFLINRWLRPQADQ